MEKNAFNHQLLKFLLGNALGWDEIDEPRMLKQTNRVHCEAGVGRMRQRQSRGDPKKAEKMHEIFPKWMRNPIGIVRIKNHLKKKHTSKSVVG